MEGRTSARRGGQARGAESAEGQLHRTRGRGLEMADGVYIYLFKRLDLTGPLQLKANCAANTVGLGEESRLPLPRDQGGGAGGNKFPGQHRRPLRFLPRPSSAGRGRLTRRKGGKQVPQPAPPPHPSQALPPPTIRKGSPERGRRQKRGEIPPSAGPPPAPATNRLPRGPRSGGEAKGMGGGGERRAPETKQSAA